MSYTVASLAQIPAVCDPQDAGRKRFYTEGVALHVPNWLEDKQLRWLIDQGQDLVTAYRTAGLSDILPESGMRDCIYDVLRLKYYSGPSGSWETTGGNITCIGFFDCFGGYVEALRESRKRGRMKIAQGVYAPSPEEAACIKQRFFLHNDLARAYAECDAADIVPTFALDRIADIVRSNPKEHLYDVIKTVWMLTQGAAPGGPVPPEHHAPAAQKRDNTLLYVASAAAAVLLSRIL